MSAFESIYLLLMLGKFLIALFVYIDNRDRKQ